ncbi:MAG: MBL fold metallo-hydrolase [bacterium]
MEIRWIGHSCLQFKGGNIAVITDPFSDEIGLKLPALQSDLVTVSHNHYDHNHVAGVTAKIVFDTPGEFEFGGIRIRGFRTWHDEEAGTARGSNVMFMFEIDGVKVLHCGDLGHPLSPEFLEKINGVDVLAVPVGGKYTLSAAQAAQLVRDIEPKIVIPIHYHVPGLKIDINNASDFINRLGSETRSVGTLSVTKKSLPTEGTIIYMLKPMATAVAA